jgi:hypothetical protein
LAGQTNWLLIYDNVDDPTSLAEIRPPDSGQLLLTSRNPALSHVADLVEISVLDRSESIALLRRRCRTLDEVRADRVAAALGDLPLAIEQAGCFLSATGLNSVEYLHLLATMPGYAGLADPTVERHPGLVTVVNVCRARLKAANPAAADLLDQLSFCAAEPLPLTSDFDTAARGEPARRFGVQIGDMATVAAAVRDTTKVGLARHAGTTLQIHRLVQALLRARLSTEETSRVRHSAQRLVATSSPGNPDDLTNWPSYAILTPHLRALIASEHGDMTSGDVEPESFRELLIAATRYLYVSGQNATGRQLAAAAFGRWTRILGAEHPDTLRAAHSLAVCLWSLGDLAGARELHEEVCHARRRVLGHDHPETLRSADSLAVDLWSLGDLSGARGLHVDTLSRRRRILGDDHPDTLRSAHNLGIDLRELGDLDGARRLHEETLGGRRRILGDDHPETLRSAHNLGIDLRELGDLDGARRLHEDTLARGRRALGDDHPETLRSADSLAVDLRELGDLAGARNLHEDTLARRRRVLGDDHPDTLRSAYNLAVDLAELGDLDGSRSLHEDTLVRRRRVLGDKHPDTEKSREWLS